MDNHFRTHRTSHCPLQQRPAIRVSIGNFEYGILTAAIFLGVRIYSQNIFSKNHQLRAAIFCMIRDKRKEGPPRPRIPGWQAKAIVSISTIGFNCFRLNSSQLIEAKSHPPEAHILWCNNIQSPRIVSCSRFYL